MIAKHMQSVQVIIDGKGQMADDTGHKSRPEGDGEGCGGLLAERGDFGRGDKVLKRPKGRVVDDVSVIIKLEGHGERI